MTSTKSQYLLDALKFVSTEYADSVLCAVKMHLLDSPSTVFSHRLWHYTLTDENLFDLSYDELQWYVLIVQAYTKS